MNRREINGEGLDSFVGTVTLEITVRQIVGPNNKRVAIFFGSPDANRYTVSTEPGVTLGNGLNQNLSVGGFWLLAKDAGPVVKKAWFGVSSSAANPIGFIEVLDNGP